MRVVLTLASGRSGTRFLYGLFRHNAEGIFRHEPYFDRGNPNLFGRPIFDRATGNLDAVRRLAEKKKAWIERTGTPLYVETSHAFLKSWWELAPELFADWKLVHLIRDPRKASKSEANRHQLLDRWRAPFRYYRADGQWFFRWSLTGREPIFQHFGPNQLTPFQWYVVQWIEIENRAIQLLRRYDKQGDCVTLASPTDLNDPRRVAEMFLALGIPMRRPTPRLAGPRNHTPRLPTVLTEEDHRQFADVIARVPEEYLAIFRHPPYTAFPWRSALERAR